MNSNVPWFNFFYYGLSQMELLFCSIFFLFFLFFLFFVSGCGVSGSNDASGGVICSGDSIGGAGNNIGDSSSSKILIIVASIKAPLGRN